MLKALNPLRKVGKHRSSNSGSSISPCNIPPIHIIKAKGDYHARRLEEISFLQGDLFHVIGENASDFYQVCNPLNNKVGLVPVCLFEIIGKNSKTDFQPAFNDDSSTPSYPASSRSCPSVPVRRPRASYTTFIAKALYNFNAEREDELGFKKNDLLVVLARSTDDWFVAKHLDGESAPGLVPVTYLELRDKESGERVSDYEDYLKRRHTSLPSVLEWKALSTSSTLSIHSIPGLDPNSPLSCTSSYYGMPETPYEPSLNEYSESTYEKAPLDTAHVTSFLADENRYLFILQLRFESQSKQRTLYREYDDFFDFHTALMRQFPKESGRTGERRIVPFMPGPLSQVDDKVTIQRRIDLDLYLQQLFLLPQYIQHTDLFRSFFRMRRGDYESPIVSPILEKKKDIELSGEGGEFKVKVNYNGEIIAFKLPKGSSNFELQRKICERFGNSISSLSYRAIKGELKPLDFSVPLHEITTTQSGQLMIFAS